MVETISNHIQNLVNYALNKNLIEIEDVTFVTNRLLDEMQINEFMPTKQAEDLPLEDILHDLIQDAIQTGVLKDSGITTCDLFDTKLMGILTPRPSEVIKHFQTLYQENRVEATNYFYKLAINSDYIRSYRVSKDMKWVYSGKYGDLDITINLSKPEKDPKAIAAAKNAKQTGYPKCLLCRENEGYAGTLTHPARENHRLIPLKIAGKDWFLQYSPYVYYNEHCIVLSGLHTPMKIDRSTFEKQLDFLDYLPHYFLGSNADLPIVGGSILAHDHMQGGHYTFAMEKAPIETKVSFEGYHEVNAGIVYWPLSVIRLQSKNRAQIVDLADKILNNWRNYTDENAFIYANTNGEPHNTITPIARMRDGAYELDLVLRNNITTDECPLGVYHPHADKHNIKKENIGLIEVMGLAVLPARLKEEIQVLADAIIENKDITSDERIAKHYQWYMTFKDKYQFTKENIQQILQNEIGKTFEGVLEDAGVYKTNKKGRNDFLKFISSIK